MNFETVKKSNKTKIITGVIVLLILTSVVMFVSTRAKYRSIQSVKLANGTINYSAPDLKLAIKVSENGTDYTSRTDIPTSGYTFNTEKSKCRIPTSTLTGENAPIAEGVTIEYTDGKINVLGVTQKDTRCYVYFDKAPTSEDTIAKLNVQNIKEGTPDFTQVATSDEGVYKIDDGLYGGKSYYWRGAATTNHMIFANKCWRIVRINGDGSIRLIYNGTPSGTTCPGNGSNSSSVVLTGTAYNLSANNSSYVGWTYTLSTQRTTSGTASNAKAQTEKWYNSNISAAAKAKIDTAGKFCNDRDTDNNETWRATGAEQYYVAYTRLSSGTKTPTLSCPNGDVYSLSVGMITADEVQFAGASGQTHNTLYYLYSGQYYWTMSPVQWNSYGRGYANVFVVDTNGYLYNWDVSLTAPGVRPVINLMADVTFNSGSNGTQNNPYIVID